MELSVREARANFAYAIEAAERGERVTITKNGKPVAEIGPPKKQVGFNWARAEQWRKENGFDKYDTPATEDIPFTGPEWTREVWGDYFDKLDKELGAE